MIRRSNLEKNISEKKHLPTLTLFDGQSFAAMRYFYDFFGKKDARELHTLICSKKREQFTKTDKLRANRIILRALKRNFPSLIKIGVGDLEQILLDRFADATTVVKTITDLAFPDMDLEFGLLTPTQFSHLDIAQQLILLLAKTDLDTVDPILAYEIRRQLALGILSIQFHELNLQNKTRPMLAELVDIFEQGLLVGPIGQTKRTVRYGVYDNQTNELISPMTQEYPTALAFWKNQPEGAHIKEFPARVREIANFGEVLFDYRPKGVASAIIKGMYEAGKCPEKRKRVDLSVIPDLSGFLFVVDLGKEVDLIEKIVTTLQAQYPNMVYREKHKNKKTNTKIERGSSPDIEFKRIMVKPHGLPEEPEIEIMVFNWNEYSAYRLHVGKNTETEDQPSYKGIATEFYNIHRTEAIANTVFPAIVYGQGEENKIRRKRAKLQKKIAAGLRDKHAEVGSAIV